MKSRHRKNLFVAGGIALTLIAFAVLTGIVYVAIVAIQTIHAD